MNPEIAEALLRVVMGEAAEGDFPDQLGVLRDLAIYKYDEYGQYVPGRQFIASLAGWLTQFDSGVERQNALRYVRERLMYVSDIEMRHLVSLMANDRIPATVQRHVAERLHIPAYRVAKVRSSPEFALASKASLFLGMSDGARIGELRRSSPELSNEQFAMTYELNSSRAETMRCELRKNSGDKDAVFQYIFLVDDISASGRTILRPDQNGNPDGRLARFVRDTLNLLTDGDCPKIFIALYIATPQALEYLRDSITSYPNPPWTDGNAPEVISVMRIEDQARLVCGRLGAEYETDRLFDKLLHKYYDESVEDEHKLNVKHGYSQ